MHYIQINIAVLHQLKFAHEYKWAKDGRCYNAKTNNEIKQVLKNRCIGYNIKGRFYSLTYLRSQLETIKEINVPF